MRWANCGPRDKLDIGVQLIAPHAKSATACFNKQKEHEPILVMAPNNASKLGTCIIAPKGTFVSGGLFTLSTENTNEPARMARIIARAQDFEQIEYELTN